MSNVNEAGEGGGVKNFRFDKRVLEQFSPAVIILIVASAFFAANIDISIFTLIPLLDPLGISRSERVIPHGVANAFVIFAVLYDVFRRKMSTQFRELSKSDIEVAKSELNKGHESEGAVVEEVEVKSGREVPVAIDASGVASGKDSIPLKGHELIADNLNKRVSSLQARATLIYWTIIFTIACGVGLIMASGYLSSLDSPAAQAWRRLASEAGAYQFSYNADASEIRKEHYRKLIEAEISNIQGISEKENVWNWPTTILRVGIAAFLLFLVQILMQLYKFNSKLIVFYSSRRDCIVMSEGEQKLAREWIEVFAPTNLDFGGDLRHPFQEVAGLIFRRGGDKSGKSNEAVNEGVERNNKEIIGDGVPKTSKKPVVRRARGVAKDEKSEAKGGF